MLIFPEKPVAEIDYAGMDFTLRIKDRTIQSITTNMRVYQGKDPSPSSMLQGPPYMFGNIAVQEIKDGLAGVQYVLSYLLTYTDGSNSEEEGLVRVVNFRS